MTHRDCIFAITSRRLFKGVIAFERKAEKHRLDQKPGQLCFCIVSDRHRRIEPMPADNGRVIQELSDSFA